MQGKQDFVNAIQSITFQPSTSSEDREVFIDFVDDEINEAIEGFFVIVSVNQSAIDPEANEDIVIARSVALLYINDDDRKSHIDSLLLLILVHLQGSILH